MEETILVNPIEKESCTICLNDDLSGEITYRTNCSHIFCKQCIEDWFERGNNSCPLCRRQVTHYESEGTQYRLIIYNSTPTQSVLIRDSLNQIRRLALENMRLRWISGLMTFSWLLLYILYMNHINTYQLSLDSYASCIHNSSKLADNLNVCLDKLTECDNFGPDEGSYVTIYGGGHFRECFYPYKYLQKCLP
jgi:hypothetical protein